MLPAINAEFRKLLTVRSTYIIFACMVLLALFFAGYVEGYKADTKMLGSPDYLAQEVISALTAVAVFCGLIAVLLFSHEYRYNTIMHTLTSTNRRIKVLLAKIIVMTAFALLFGLVLGSFSPLASYVGTQLAGHDPVTQAIPYSDLLWRGLFYTWGYAMIGLLLVALVRNQVFAVVALFFIPVTVELIAAALLKANAIYLPFTSLNNVLSNNPDVTHLKSAVIFLVHMVCWWLIAYLLFIRRDATNSRG